MKRPFPIKLPLVALLAAVVVALLTWGMSPATVLEMRIGENGPVARSIQVTPGERITYRYLHSVEKVWIEEILEVASNGHLVVRETIYDGAGRGIPSDMPEGDFSVDPVTHKFRISNMNRDMPSWPVRVAFTAEQTVQLGNETFRLDSVAAPTTLLSVVVVTHPRLGFLQHPSNGQSQSRWDQLERGK